MKTLKNRIRDIPFIILLINGIGWVLSHFEAYQYYYFYMSQISGHGILTCIFMGFYAYVHRFCVYSKVCIGALMGLNILNLLYNMLSLSYYNLYSLLIIATGIIFGLIRYVKHDYSPT